MKKVYSILMTLLALSVFAPLSQAQTTRAEEDEKTSIADLIGELNFGDKDPYTTGNYTVNKNVGFSKVISEPQSDGTYWIKLEAFATGSSVVSAEPADIVLVLDYSGSMNEEYSGASGDYSSLGYREWTYGNFGNNTYYYFYDGQYRAVTRGGNGYGTGRYLTFTANGSTYYLNDNLPGGIGTTRPTQPTSNNLTIWTGELFTIATTRLHALKDAVSDFIRVIYHNDNYEDDSFDHPRDTPLTNRISIVAFSSNSNNTHQIAGWTPVTNEDGSINTSLENAVRIEGTNNGTFSNRGMNLANTLLSQINNGFDEPRESSRTVVLFTDGVPGNTMTWNSSSLTTGSDCIRAAYTAKNTYGATVFTVSIWDGDYSTDGGQNMLKYLNYTSSNYPNAYPDENTLNNPGKRCDDESIPEKDRKDPIYQKDAGDDLSAVFTEIAKMSGGGTNLSQSSSAVDIVSSSFVVEKTEDKQVLLFTAKCKTADPENKKYTFYEEIVVDKSTDTYDTYDDEGNVIDTGLDVDANITLKPDASDPNKITVVGFDYSNNWCGPKTDAAGNTEIMGHKLIIMIPVKMNPDAIGGPNVATNLPGSGIFETEEHAEGAEPLVAFETPHVSLPVNIHLEKLNLKPGESAKFRIDRAVLPSAADPESEDYDPDWKPADLPEDAWNYVSTVFVTNSPNSKLSQDGNPMIKVRGMPANGTDGNYVYRITEENWSWSYEANTAPQYTVTSQVDNPFSFTNTPRTNIDQQIRHAESKASNHFKPVSGTKGDVKYDDSKQNTRTNASGSGSGSTTEPVVTD